MKTINIKSFVLILAIIVTLVFGLHKAQAQDTYGLSVLTDARLMILGDEEHNIKAGTTDVLIRFIMQGKQQKYGYMVVFPEFEFANIDGNYKRFTVNGGYMFNQLFIKNLELGLTLNAGWQDRYKLAYLTYGGTIEIKYNLTDSFSLVSSLRGIKRGDLAYRYNDTEIKKEAFVGFQYNF